MATNTPGKDEEIDESPKPEKMEISAPHIIPYDSVLILFIGVSVLLLPIIILSLPIVKDQINLTWENLDLIDPAALKEGIVFIATASILERLAVRTIFRVFFRTGSRTVARSGVRASGRAVFRTAIKTQSRTLVKPTIDERVPSILSLDYSRRRNIFTDLFTLFVTWLILVTSFWIVTLLLAQEILFIEGLLLIVPIGIIFLVEQVMSWILKVEFDFHITRDGTLIQFLFSLGSSFIPLAHDTYIHGTLKQKSQVGLTGWLALLVASGVFFISWLITSSDLDFWLVSHCVLFMLVISIPVQPLEGADFWDYNRKLAIAIFGFSLIYSMFIFMIPVERSMVPALTDFI